MEELGVDVGKSLMTKALYEIAFQTCAILLVRYMRGGEAGGRSVFL